MNQAVSFPPVWMQEQDRDRYVSFSGNCFAVSAEVPTRNYPVFML